MWLPHCRMSYVYMHMLRWMKKEVLSCLCMCLMYAVESWVVLFVWTFDDRVTRRLHCTWPFCRTMGHRCTWLTSSFRTPIGLSVSLSVGLGFYCSVCRKVQLTLSKPTGSNEDNMLVLMCVFGWHCCYYPCIRWWMIHVWMVWDINICFAPYNSMMSVVSWCEIL